MGGRPGSLNLGEVTHFKIELTCSLKRTFSYLSSLDFLLKVHVFKELSIGQDLPNCFQEGKIDHNLLKGLSNVISLLVFLRRKWCIQSLRVRNLWLICDSGVRHNRRREWIIFFFGFKVTLNGLKSFLLIMFLLTHFVTYFFTTPKNHYSFQCSNS